MKKRMRNNIFVVATFLLFCIVFAGCNKVATCILWQEGDWDMWASGGGAFDNIESDSRLVATNVRCEKVEVLIGREENEFYTKQMVKTLVDSLLHLTTDIKKIEIIPARPYFNTKQTGAYRVIIDYPFDKRIVGFILFDGNQFILPPYPEQIIEIRKNKKVSDGIREVRRHKRAHVLYDVIKNEKERDHCYTAFLNGYGRGMGNRERARFILRSIRYY